MYVRVHGLYHMLVCLDCITGRCSGPSHQLPSHGCLCPGGRGRGHKVEDECPDVDSLQPMGIVLRIQLHGGGPDGSVSELCQYHEQGLRRQHQHIPHLVVRPDLNPDLPHSPSSHIFRSHPPTPTLPNTTPDSHSDQMKLLCMQGLGEPVLPHVIRPVVLQGPDEASLESAAAQQDQRSDVKRQEDSQLKEVRVHVDPLCQLGDSWHGDKYTEPG